MYSIDVTSLRKSCPCLSVHFPSTLTLVQMLVAIFLYPMYSADDQTELCNMYQYAIYNEALNIYFF